MAKTKEDYSKELNGLLCLEGNEEVDFTKLKQDDLHNLYELFIDPNRFARCVRKCMNHYTPNAVKIVRNNMDSFSGPVVKEILKDRPLLRAFLFGIEEGDK